MARNPSKNNFCKSSNVHSTPTSLAARSNQGIVASRVATERLRRKVPAAFLQLDVAATFVFRARAHPKELELCSTSGNGTLDRYAMLISGTLRGSWHPHMFM